MNFLAHLFFSESAPGFVVGSLAADFLSSDWRSSDPDVRAGIARHQEVDRLTDAHPLHRQSRQHVRACIRHARGVVVDVFYDHFLAVYWDRFSDEPLKDFAARIHAVLLAHREICPPTMQAVMPRFIAENWLEAYRTREGIRSALVRLTRRSRGRVDFALAMDDLAVHHASLEEEFLAFFPQLRAAIHQSAGPKGASRVVP
jgi:acyl carrier protein phosphodiesterase